MPAFAGLGHGVEIPKTGMNKLPEKIQQAMMTIPNFTRLKDHVEITITPDGLRIELLETEAGIFFEQGKPVPSSNGAKLPRSLAQQLGELPNLIEGHSDAKPTGGEGSYT